MAEQMPCIGSNDWNLSNPFCAVLLCNRYPLSVIIQLHRLPDLGAQMVQIPSAPPSFSTSLYKVCYRRIADFILWCHFFVAFWPYFSSRQLNNNNFCVLHKKTTAFLYTIRGPPSEI